MLDVETHLLFVMQFSSCVPLMYKPEVHFYVELKAMIASDKPKKE